MTLYNALVAVVELVDADSPEGAIQALSARLRQRGSEPYNDDQDAVESEPVDAEPTP